MPRSGFAARWKAGRGDELLHAVLAALDFGEVELRVRRASAPACVRRGRDRAVHCSQQRALPGVGGGLENLEIAQGGGVEQQGFVRAVFAQFAQVLRLGAECFGGVVDECAGGPEGGMVAVDAEALEVQHAEGLHHGLSAGALSKW